MEKLKSVIPETLKHKISHSTAADLDSTCSSLLDFFQNLPLFHQLVRDLTDPQVALCGKNKEAALEAKAKGNQCFTNGDYSNALLFYSQALRSAPMDAEDNEKNLVATLYLNRASSLHKLGLFLESLQDCNRALILSPVYAKTWFRRAKANSSLGNYEEAINDFGVSMEIETSLSGKRQIENELNQLMDQSRLRSSVKEKQHDGSADEPLQVELRCASTPNKGRGMISLTNIPMASLIYKEDPHGAIILKHCRETHCAFCFNELQADTVPCVSCSIPLYCSLKCQVQAGGEDFLKYKAEYGFKLDLSDDLERHIRNVTSPSFSSPDVKHFAEHRHECQGMHWPAVLPSDVVLAGRIIVKHIEEQAYGGLDHNVHKILDLSQNYGQLSSDTKLEFHVYSIILLCCLQRFYATKLPLNSTITSEIIMLLSKIRINSMAVVRMKYSDVKQPLNYDLTSSVEQIEVAQAVYSGGSLFNHSCEPNIHAYFLSRTLFMRATENVTAGLEMELSYGPQVGQWDCGKRRRFLKDRYSFICKCSGCAQVNLSDLFHGGYRCTKPNCDGVVLDSSVIKHEKEKIRHCERLSCLQDNVPSDDSINKLAHYMYEQTDYHWLEPGSCLVCATFCDLQASKKSISKAEVHIQRMKDAMTSGALTTNLLMDALRYVDLVRAKLHPFNRRLAEVEDNIAQAFCLIGDLQAGMDHCRASIEILEKLYGESHIAIGNELIKLASIQFSMGQEISSDYTTRIVAIFSRCYGSHAEIIFPYVRYLKKESCRVV
ncbi:SET and MYND domain-containing protein 4 isoform X1 [Salvia hispanica]|uniref:SET and MYND domain-containing protein 4 isoform X1 n=2 Tax=Salvia hispanica TaxID=49212 RepID=UPI002009A2D8|nr:SET and MYND domain-containing protein 4 isoform X1 [Salvia hispanica]